MDLSPLPLGNLIQFSLKRFTARLEGASLGPPTLTFYVRAGRGGGRALGGTAGQRRGVEGAAVRHGPPGAREGSSRGGRVGRGVPFQARLQGVLDRGAGNTNAFTIVRSHGV